MSGIAWVYLFVAIVLVGLAIKYRQDIAQAFLYILAFLEAVFK